MDRQLLTLWKAVPSGNVKKEELAEALRLSTKQTSRYIQKWTKEEWLTFSSGRGRGKVSTLQWLKNVEEMYEEQLLNSMDKWSVEEMYEEQLLNSMDKWSIEMISKYLLWDWSKDSKLRLMEKFRSKFGYTNNLNVQDKLLIPKVYPFLSMHPLVAADANSVSLIANIYNRLVAVNHNGEVLPELVHSWEETSTRLRLYLKKDVIFHDGSILVAEDVVHCLQKLQNHSHFQDLWKPVTSIVTKAPLVVDLEFPNGCSYCLQMLSMLNASIYKEMKGTIIGTGPFYIEENSETRTSLVAFKEYFQERPLLDSVEFVIVPQDFGRLYRAANLEGEKSTFSVESNSGFGVIMMNAFRQSAINRKEVRDYLHYIIAKNRHTIVDVNPLMNPNDQGCLTGVSEQYDIEKVNRPYFSEPLILKIMNYTEKATMWLKEILEKEGVPVQLKWVPFEDTLYNEKVKQEVDLFVHGEVFEMNQHFSFYFFLKNGYSPLPDIIKTDEGLLKDMAEYERTPFEKWPALNKKVEKSLLEASLMIPLYHKKRKIPFSEELKNVTIKHFGYVDFSKLWVKPNIE
ncbi:ABC transporter substrate-binding protein [Bacillus spongiae]|uniref:ABC transporter substrate-binding protein n=1 Tax=Bacillus spongiae TaxID=2683610 RepID=A0ABU8HH14_9BACI